VPSLPVRAKTLRLVALVALSALAQWARAHRTSAPQAAPPATVGPSGMLTSSSQSSPLQTTAASPQREIFEFNKQIFYTTSTDCVHWAPSKLLLKGCDTPQLAWIRGKLYVFYAYFDETPEHLPFKQSEVIVRPPGEIELGEPRVITVLGERNEGQTDPSVLATRDGYRLYYVNPPRCNFQSTGPNDDPAVAQTQIRSAYSRDGQVWTKDPGVRLQGRGLVDPEAALTPDGKTRLYYTLGADFCAHSAISSDGLHFVDERGQRMHGGVTSTLRLSDGSYVTVHQTPPSDIGDHPLCITHSKNGLDFSPSTVIELGDIGFNIKLEAPTLARLANKRWLLLYIKAPFT
jgi:hypothetical protein